MNNTRVNHNYNYFLITQLTHFNNTISLNRYYEG